MGNRLQNLTFEVYCQGFVDFDQKCQNQPLPNQLLCDICNKRKQNIICQVCENEVLGYGFCPKHFHLINEAFAGKYFNWASPRVIL